MDRGRGESSLIFGVNRAHITFGRDVQPNRFGDPRREIAREPHPPYLLVPAVNAVIGDILRQFMQQVSDVMGQRGGDEPPKSGKSALLLAASALLNPTTSVK